MSAEDCEVGINYKMTLRDWIADNKEELDESKRYDEKFQKSIWYRGKYYKYFTKKMMNALVYDVYWGDVLSLDMSIVDEEDWKLDSDKLFRKYYKGIVKKGEIK